MVSGVKSHAKQLPQLAVVVLNEPMDPECGEYHYLLLYWKRHCPATLSWLILFS